MTIANRDLAELLSREAEQQDQDHRRRALRRAARWSLMWPEEAAALALEDRPLTELPSVGRWVAHIIRGWLADPPAVPEPPPERAGFMTRSEARAELAAAPEWEREVRADHQVHTTWSDGRAPLDEMVRAASTYGYERVAITDHSKGLPIANGMDEARLAAQRVAIDTLNVELERSGERIRALRSIEMNLSLTGEGDMDPTALARLDLVLGAFHSRLRVREDQTARYVAAVSNPTVHVLAHPRGRRFGARLGLTADWRVVFEAAAEHRTAVEIDAYPDRQDLDVELLGVARETGVTFSIGTDAHNPDELRFLDIGLAAALRAGLPRERILNFAPTDALLAWTRG